MRSSVRSSSRVTAGEGSPRRAPHAHGGSGGAGAGHQRPGRGEVGGRGGVHPRPAPRHPGRQHLGGRHRLAAEGPRHRGPVDGEVHGAAHPDVVEGRPAGVHEEVVGRPLHVPPDPLARSCGARRAPAPARGAPGRSRRCRRRRARGPRRSPRRGPPGSPRGRSPGRRPRRRSPGCAPDRSRRPGGRPPRGRAPPRRPPRGSGRRPGCRAAARTRTAGPARAGSPGRSG